MRAVIIQIYFNMAPHRSRVDFLIKGGSREYYTEKY